MLRLDGSEGSRKKCLSWPRQRPVLAASSDQPATTGLWLSEVRHLRTAAALIVFDFTSTREDAVLGA